MEEISSYEPAPAIGQIQLLLLVEAEKDRGGETFSGCRISRN